MQLWRLCLPLLIVQLMLPGCSHAVKIATHPHSQQCISQTFSDLLAEGLVQEGQLLQVTASLRMLGGTPGNAAEGDSAASHLQVAIIDPEGHQMLQQQLQHGQVDLAAPTAGLGSYSLCLNNAGDAEIMVDIVHFDLVEQGDSGAAAPIGSIGIRSQSQLGPVREQVLWLQGLLQQLQAEQRAMHERLDRHYATNLDTNHRTLYCSLAEMAALLATSLLQVVVIQWFFRRHSGTISRHLSAQALAQNLHAKVGDLSAASLVERTPNPSFSRDSFSSGGGLTRSFSRRRLPSDHGDFDGIAVTLFDSPSPDSHIRRGRGWGSSGSLPQLASLAAPPPSPGQGGWLGRSPAGIAPARRHSTHAERGQPVVELQAIARSPVAALQLLGMSNSLQSATVAQQAAQPLPHQQRLQSLAAWQHESGGGEMGICRSASAASFGSVEIHNVGE